MSSLYKKAATIYGKVIKGNGTIKGLVFAESVEGGLKKKLFALVCETLKYREVIDELIEKSGILKSKPKIERNLASILIYDLFFGHGLKDAGALRNLVLNHKTRLGAELAKIKIRRKVKANADLVPERIRNAVNLPRYVRVNTNATTVTEAVARFKKDGFTYAEDDGRGVAADAFYVDPHVPELLVFPPNTDLHDYELLTMGHIVLQ
ncbi:putative 28S rRNA (cytosine-C(5))-methyltransferase, partial [Irineochytrium annulatum]